MSNQSNKPLNPNAPTTLWNKGFIMVVCLGLLSSSASQMVTTLITKYAKQDLGMSLTLAATLSSTMSLVALFFRPFSGLVADAFNRKKIMMFSTIVTAACVFAYGLVPNASLLFALRIVHGIAFAFQGVANTAFSASFIPDDRMGEGLGLVTMGQLLAQAVGPSIGLTLSQTYSFKVVFFLSASLSVLAAIFITFIPYSQQLKPKEERTKFEFKGLLNRMIEKKVIVFAVILGTFSAGNGLMNTYANLMGDERGINFAMFFTAYSLMTLVSRPFIGKLLDKKGATVVLLPAFAVASIGMCFVAGANALWMVIIAGCLKALGQGSATPTVHAISIKEMGRERAGVITSTCLIGQDLGNTLGPIVGSFIVERFSYKTLFFGYAAVLFTVSNTLYFVHLAVKKHKAKKAAAAQ